MVEAAQEYISAGDIYQVNLSHRMEAPFRGDAFPSTKRCGITRLRLLERICSNRADGAFSSPESFLRMSGRAIRTRPIKGTRPRRAEPHAGREVCLRSAHFIKGLAELVMITDWSETTSAQSASMPVCMSPSC
jgi:para-aminobenzoate synthetase component 1